MAEFNYLLAKLGDLVKQISRLIGIVLIASCTGCAVSDLLFGAFGSAYSGGGETMQEKRYDYDQQILSSQSYD